MAKATGKLVVKFTPEQLEELKKEVIEQAYNQGFKAAGGKALQWLEDKYMKGDDRPDRGSPEANAILVVTGELAAYMRTEVEKL